MIVIINYCIQAKLLPPISPDLSAPAGGRHHLRPGGSPPAPRLSPGALGGSQADQNLYRPGQSFICIYIYNICLCQDRFRTEELSAFHSSFLRDSIRD